MRSRSTASLNTSYVPKPFVCFRCASRCISTVELEPHDRTQSGSRRGLPACKVPSASRTRGEALGVPVCDHQRPRKGPHRQRRSKSCGHARSKRSVLDSCCSVCHGRCLETRCEEARSEGSQHGNCVCEWGVPGFCGRLVLPLHRREEDTELDARASTGEMLTFGFRGARHRGSSELFMGSLAHSGRTQLHSGTFIWRVPP